MAKIKWSEKLYQWKMKDKLKSCFRASGLYFTNKLGDRTIYIYPKIHSVLKKEKENCTELTFTLLSGLDPKEVKKKEFVFQQIFGRSIDITGDLKKYTVTIYHTPLSTKLIYKYENIKPYLEGIKFPIITGQKKNGKYLILDALELPHILIQGVSGSGKSSAIRVILTTLIKTLKPSELDIWCVDGKKAEFQLFKKVEHVQGVFHAHTHVRKMLNHIIKIMNHREDLQEQFDVPHIDDLPEEHRQKYILLAIDEMYEYMDDKIIQEGIMTIASKGRSVGIILLLSAQRFDADVIDTKSRANFNIRMSFRAVDKTNARLIGTEGAEKIGGEHKGRFILNYGNIEELQSPHLTYDKAKKLLNPFFVNNDIKDVSEFQSETSNDNKLIEGNQKLIEQKTDLDLFL